MSKKYHPYRPLSIEDEPESQAVKAKRRPPSREKIREMALNSHEGGRIRCDYCHHTFGAYYVQLVHSWPQEPQAACNDCRKAKNLQKKFG
jgi:hypothetical protein